MITTGSESIRPHYVPQFGVDVQVYPVGMFQDKRRCVASYHICLRDVFNAWSVVMPRDHVYFVIFYSSTVDSVGVRGHTGKFL
jgi:hypothetical protein